MGYSGSDLYEEDQVELCDLNKDISEQYNLALEYPKKEVALQKKLRDFQKGMGAKMPKKNITIN